MLHVKCGGAALSSTGDASGSAAAASATTEARVPHESESDHVEEAGGGAFGPTMVPAEVPGHRQPLATRDGVEVAPVETNNVCCGHDYLPRRCEWWRNLGRGRSSSPLWPLPDTHTASWSAYPCRSGHRRLRSGIERAWSMEPWLDFPSDRWASHLRSRSRGRSSARDRHSGLCVKVDDGSERVSDQEKSEGSGGQGSWHFDELSAIGFAIVKSATLLP